MSCIPLQNFFCSLLLRAVLKNEKEASKIKNANHTPESPEHEGNAYVAKRQFVFDVSLRVYLSFHEPLLMPACLFEHVCMCVQPRTLVVGTESIQKVTPHVLAPCFWTEAMTRGYALVFGCVLACVRAMHVRRE
jgi:hypothetical protein